MNKVRCSSKNKYNWKAHPKSANFSLRIVDVHRNLMQRHPEGIGTVGQGLLTGA